MNCACEQDKDGNVTGLCRAHQEIVDRMRTDYFHATQRREEEQRIQYERLIVKLAAKSVGVELKP